MKKKSLLDNNNNKKKKSPHMTGMKRYEYVLADLMTKLEQLNRNSSSSSSNDSTEASSTINNNSSLLPSYVQLPKLMIQQQQQQQAPPPTTTISPNWPFNILPPAANILRMSEQRTSQQRNRHNRNNNNHSQQQKEAQRIMKLQKRIWSKECQIRSVLACILPMLRGGDDGDDIRVGYDSIDYHHLQHHQQQQQEEEEGEGEIDHPHHARNNKRLKIVDFGGASGNLALPLALLLPQVDVVIVDIKKASLELAQRRAKAAYNELLNGDKTNTYLDDDIDLNNYAENMVNDMYVGERGKELLSLDDKPKEVECEGVSNLKIFHGDIRAYDQNFDLGIALHCCGDATDLVMEQCKKYEAGFVAIPCCVGKLNRSNSNPYVYQTTKGNEMTITYPRSTLFQKCLSANEFDVLASAADYGELQDLGTCKGAARRYSKTLLEWDRCLWAKQQGYSTIISRVVPFESTPKHDIIIGWLEQKDIDKALPLVVSSPFPDGALCIECTDSNLDLDVTKGHFLLKLNHSSPSNFEGEIKNRRVASDTSSSAEWAKEEEEEIAAVLRDFIQDNSQNEYRFPPGQTSRKRKAIHFIAERMNLNHRSENKTSSKRVLVVTKKV